MPKTRIRVRWCGWPNGWTTRTSTAWATRLTTTVSASSSTTPPKFSFMPMESEWWFSSLFLYVQSKALELKPCLSWKKWRAAWAKRESLEKPQAEFVPSDSPWERLLFQLEDLALHCFFWHTKGLGSCELHRWIFLSPVTCSTLIGREWSTTFPSRPIRSRWRRKSRWWNISGITCRKIWSRYAGLTFFSQKWRKKIGENCFGNELVFMKKTLVCIDGGEPDAAWHRRHAASSVDAQLVPISLGHQHASHQRNGPGMRRVHQYHQSHQLVKIFNPDTRDDEKIDCLLTDFLLYEVWNAVLSWVLSWVLTWVLSWVLTWVLTCQNTP